MHVRFFFLLFSFPFRISTRYSIIYQVDFKWILASFERVIGLLHTYSGSTWYYCSILRTNATPFHEPLSSMFSDARNGSPGR